MTFSAEALLNSITTDASETERVLVPVQEWPSQITELAVEQSGDGKDGKLPWVKLRMGFRITDKNCQNEMGIDPDHDVVVNHRIFVHLTEDKRHVASGVNRNVELGKIRVACGLNDPGEEFSLSMLKGCTPMIHVEHQASKKDPTRKYEVVASVNPPQEDVDF